MKQKLIGILGIILSVLSPFLLDGDATISIITLPLGVYMLFTKEKIVN